MAVTLSLPSAPVAVEPGETAERELTVTNTGTVVDQFGLGVVGGADAWISVEPSTLNLLPGTSAVATVRFAPPRSAAVRSGRHDFGIKAASREDPASSSVEEGTVEVAAFHELAAELVPASRRARRRAGFKLAVDNLGNADADATVLLADPDDHLGLSAVPATVPAAAGTTTIVRVRAVPHRRFLRGQPKRLPFAVVVQAPEVEPVHLEGAVQQEQLLPQWLLPVTAALGVLLVAAVAAWFALLKPAVESVATERTEEQVQKAENAAASASGAAEQAGAAATVAQQAAGVTPTPGQSPGGSQSSAGPGSQTPGQSPTPGNSPGASPRPGGATPAPTGPTSFRIATQSAAVTDGSFQSFRYSAPAGRRVDIADLVLQNPRGDAGIIRISLGDDIVLESGLANFRDLDYHYLQPLRAEPGRPVVVSVNCTVPGAGAARCTPSVSFSGQLR